MWLKYRIEPFDTFDFDTGLIRVRYRLQQQRLVGFLFWKKYVWENEPKRIYLYKSGLSFKIHEKVIFDSKYIGQHYVNFLNKQYDEKTNL